MFFSMFLNSVLKRLQRLCNKIINNKPLILVTFVLGVSYCLGIFTMLVEVSYEKDFRYPLSKNITKYVEQLKNREFPDMLPINTYDFKFLYPCSEKCQRNSVRVVYLVKSAIHNFDRRKTIRKSWGFEKRFSDVNIKTVFLLGTGKNGEIDERVSDENERHKDIILANFMDDYYNNTYKTMVGFKWAMMYCKNAKFYFFSDDDMYVSTKNLLQFLHNPFNYPAYLELPILAVEDGDKKTINDLMDFELPEDVVLYAGYIFPTSRPQRHIFSKWYVSMTEYPYDQYPPYITAGAYVVSRQALINLFYGSAYTVHFRFDDIYLGIVAKKINLEPFHCDEFYFYKKPYNVFNYKYVIASHGFEEEDELLQVWNEQKSAGSA